MSDLNARIGAALVERLGDERALQAGVLRRLQWVVGNQREDSMVIGYDDKERADKWLENMRISHPQYVKTMALEVYRLQAFADFAAGDGMLALLVAMRELGIPLVQINYCQAGEGIYGVHFRYLNMASHRDLPMAVALAAARALGLEVQDGE